MQTFKNKIQSTIRKHYRLIIRREEDLSEKVSVILTPLNVILILSTAFVVFGFFIYLTFSFTPLKQLMPENSIGMGASEQYQLLVKIDSLEETLSGMRIKAHNLERILDGEVPDIQAGNELDTNDHVPGGVEFKGPGEVEKQLREEMESEQSYNQDAEWKNIRSSQALYKPMEGIISDSFNLARRHYAVDLVGEENSVVKAALDGTVLISSWNPETGHVLVLQHSNNLVSIYKHNSVLFKKEGNFVKTGEAVAVVGNSGELTNGPHLHFELWQNGTPLNPANYVVF